MLLNGRLPSSYRAPGDGDREANEKGKGCRQASKQANRFIGELFAAGISATPSYDSTRYDSDRHKEGQQDNRHDPDWHRDEEVSHEEKATSSSALVYLNPDSHFADRAQRRRYSEDAVASAAMRTAMIIFSSLARSPSAWMRHSSEASSRKP